MERRAAHINAGRPLEPKKTYRLNKVSPKRAAKIEAQKASGDDNSMDAFFEAMIERCTGKCLFCNAPTMDIKLYKIKNEKISIEANEAQWEREAEKMKRIAVAHLLPKSKFGSVAINENNWIELCWSCHTSFDNGAISWEFIFDSKEIEIIKEKLLIVLPVVAEAERKNKLYSKLESLVYGKKQE